MTTRINDQNQMATFTKLRSGDWGVRAPAGTRKGDILDVRRRDGSISTVEVERVLWTGDGIALCSIYDDRPTYRRSSGRRTRRTEGGCLICGAPATMRASTGPACVNHYDELS